MNVSSPFSHRFFLLTRCHVTTKGKHLHTRRNLLSAKKAQIRQTLAYHLVPFIKGILQYHLITALHIKHSNEPPFQLSLQWRSKLKIEGKQKNLSSLVMPSSGQYECEEVRAPRTFLGRISWDSSLFISMDQGTNHSWNGCLHSEYPSYENM